MTSIYRVFEVTEERIEGARSRDSSSCPIAEAIGLTERNARHIMVDLATIRWSDPTKGKRYIFMTPKYAQQFIVDFDRGDGEHARPFILRLRTPVQITDMRHDEHKRYASVRRAQRVASRVEVSATGLPTKIGGNRIPTGGNIQRQRRYGARALKR